MSPEPELFVVTGGPSGAGKSTVVEHVRVKLAAQGVPVVAAREPSDSAFGKLRPRHRPVPRIGTGRPEPGPTSFTTRSRTEPAEAVAAVVLDAVLERLGQRSG